ncbi:MAG: DUF4332 domain-containing protein [Ardenticatenales bacterium]|nr:DUF4332 domain-containing protein [Ardenticatenales bacterium]
MDTVKEPATRRADNQHPNLLDIDAKKRLAGRAPSLDMVKDWVAQAKQLPRLLQY